MTSRVPNLNPVIVQKISDCIDLTFVPECDKRDKNAEFCPVDLLDYNYALLHSPRYREKYKDFLKADFPRIPYPKQAADFFSLVALGSELRQWHLLTHPDMDKSTITYQGEGNNKVDKPLFDAGKVLINATQYFNAVPESAWLFYIGGYQPAQKWLKDRKDSSLGRADIVHYKRLLNALIHTHSIMQQIDRVV